MFAPSVFIVAIPSSSVFTSPGASPIPTFQYDEPGTIIWLMKKKWFMESKAWIAPAAPDRNHRGPNLATEHILFAFATKPARSIKAFISGRNISKIGRRCKDNTVSIKHLFDAVVEHVCIHHTLFILAFETFPAGGTTPDIFSCQLDDARF